MTTGIKNENEIGVKFLFTIFSQIRMFYSVIMRTTNIFMGPNVIMSYLNVILQGIEPPTSKWILTKRSIKTF